MTDDIDNSVTDTISASGTSIRQTVLISVASSMITLLVYVFLFQPLHMIQDNQAQLETQKEALAELKQSVKISREELTLQMQDYINENYGDISERDENIAKLMIYFKQQDARLSNIEEALSKF